MLAVAFCSVFCDALRHHAGARTAMSAGDYVDTGSGLGGGRGNKGSVTDAEERRLNIIAHVIVGRKMEGRRNPRRRTTRASSIIRDCSRASARRSSFGGLFCIWGRSAGIYSHGKNAPTYRISISQSDECFLVAVSDCLRTHGFPDYLLARILYNLSPTTAHAESRTAARTNRSRRAASAQRRSPACRSERPVFRCRGR